MKTYALMFGRLKMVVFSFAQGIGLVGAPIRRGAKPTFGEPIRRLAESRGKPGADDE